MSEYQMVKNEYGDIDPCECCGFEVATALFDKPSHLQSEEGRRRTVSEQIKRENQFRYCEVCSRTLISSVHGYPMQHHEDGHVLLCMAQCTNMILEAIRKASHE